jgi:hypothetical protein
MDTFTSSSILLSLTPKPRTLRPPSNARSHPMLHERSIPHCLDGSVFRLVSRKRLISSLSFLLQGSWGGPSIRKNKPKPQFIKKIPGIAPTDRADHGKANIIISEKRDKKLAKYQVKDLPYPYTSRAQFERSMEAPLGSEWNTRVAFQKGTLPRVVKKVRRFRNGLTEWWLIVRRWGWSSSRCKSNSGAYMYCRILCAWTGLVFHACGCKEDLNLRPGLALLPPYTKCCTMSPYFMCFRLERRNCR